MDGRIIESISGEAGKVFEIRNHSDTATTYCIEFVGAGHVRFDVLPGGNFSFVSNGHVVNVNIEDSAPEGINLA